MKVFFKFALAFGITAIAGCSGGGATSNVSSVPCVDLTGSFLTPILYSPAPGSVNVPVNVGVIDVSNSGRGSYRVTLSPASGPQLYQTDAVPSNSSGAQMQLAIPQLAPRTTYSVSIEDLNCHTLSGSSIGAFTTQ